MITEKTMNLINDRVNAMTEAEVNDLLNAISAVPEDVFDEVCALDSEYFYGKTTKTYEIRRKIDKLLKPYKLSSIDWFVWDCL